MSEIYPATEKARQLWYDEVVEKYELTMSHEVFVEWVAEEMLKARAELTLRNRE